MLPRIHIHTGDLVSAIESLRVYFRDGGTSIIQAAFAHTYFIHPDDVREKTPYFPDSVRQSREHYPGLDRGKTTTFAGDGREVTLDDNSRAQMAWERYTGTKLERGSGYGVRHIWGNTHNPDAFTAGWNLCYMPFWAGMLTEEQHPLPELQQAIRQASWDLFFSNDAVCNPPNFVQNPGIPLDICLDERPLLVLSRDAGPRSAQPPRIRRQASTLPITLEPPNSEDFLAVLLRTKEAWFEISYTDGRKEVRHWDASRMGRSSNVINNLRSRPEFRAGTWQKKDIAGLRVSIERPRNAGE